MPNMANIKYMKKTIIVTNDAEASGNTTLTVLLHSHLTRKNLRVKVVTTSIEQELPMDVTLLDVEDGFKPETFIDLVDHSDVVIVDVHTGGAEKFERRFFKNHIDEALEEIQCGLTVVLPCCDDEHVLHNAMDRARAYSRNAEFLVAHMPLLADDHQEYKGSPAQRLLTQMGAMEVTIPQMEDGIMDELDAMDLDMALALSQREHLPRYVRHELLKWEVGACENLRSAEDLLVPDTSVASDDRADSIYGRTLAFH